MLNFRNHLECIPFQTSCTPVLPRCCVWLVPAVRAPPALISPRGQQLRALQGIPRFLEARLGSCADSSGIPCFRPDDRFAKSWLSSRLVSPFRHLPAAPSDRSQRPDKKQSPYLFGRLAELCLSLRGRVISLVLGSVCFISCEAGISRDWESKTIKTKISRAALLAHKVVTPETKTKHILYSLKILHGQASFWQ